MTERDLQSRIEFMVEAILDDVNKRHPNSKHKGNKSMIDKKPDAKKPPRSRLSMAACMLGGAVRATLQISSSEETWRNKKLNSKNCFKR